MALNRVAVLHGIEDVRLEDRPVPRPGPRELLVEVRAVGVCGSDVHYYREGRIGNHVVRAPLVLGHEVSGVVVDAGPEADRTRIGDRVALEPGVPCGACRECRSGAYNLCRSVRFFATPPVDGAFGRYVTIHQDFAFTLPETVSDEEGALIEPLAVGLWATRRGHVGPGDRVLVTGAGPIGLVTAQAALVAGAAEVVVTDVNAARLAAAGRIDGVRPVDVTTTQVTDAVAEVDAFIECSGARGVLGQGLAVVRPRGTVVAVGMAADDEVSLRLSLVQDNELTLTGVFRYAGVYPAAIALVASGRLDLGSMISSRFPLEETAAALEAGRLDPTTVKAMVIP